MCKTSFSQYLNQSITLNCCDLFASQQSAHFRANSYYDILARKSFLLFLKNSVCYSTSVIRISKNFSQETILARQNPQNRLETLCTLGRNLMHTSGVSLRILG